MLKPQKAIFVCGLGLLSVGCPAGGALDDPNIYTGLGSGTGGAAEGVGGTDAGTGGSAPIVENCLPDAPLLLAASCSGATTCHGAEGKPPGLDVVDLVTPPSGMTMGQSMVNRPAKAYFADDLVKCPSAAPDAVKEFLIDTANPEASVVLGKTKAGAVVETDFACGEKMPPQGYIPLTTEEIATVREWVLCIAATYAP